MNHASKLILFLTAFIFLAVAVTLYFVVSGLITTSGNQRKGEELISAAAAISLVASIVVIFVLLGYSFMGKCYHSINFYVLIGLLVIMGSVQVLIGIGLGSLKDSPDWEYNKKYQTELIISLCSLLLVIPLCAILLTKKPDTSE